MDDQLKDLHETNGYYVGIHKLVNHNKVRIEYPSDIVREPDSKPLINTYEISDNIIDHEFHAYIYKYDKDNTVPSKLKTPIYAARIVVISDILFTCVKLSLNSLLITNFNADGEKVEDTMQLLDPPESINEQELEQNLKVIFHQMMEGNSSCNFLVDAGDVMEGYELLLNVFKTGGF